ncbi:type IV pilin protein [Massilia sp. SM-13]|uniref:type IV pilin protein n=1 Tax=Pseudoduganella rhizocola TaxID=3382643 RepID=UPI0038B64093
MRISAKERQLGFSLFELAVTLTVLSILSAVFFSRFAGYREQAEDVVVQQLVASMRTSLAVRVAQLQGAENTAGILALAETNPLNLLEKYPANYGGEVDAADVEELPGGKWYFLKRERLLIYVLNHRNSVAIKGQKSLNFKVKLLHSSNKAVREATTNPSLSLMLESV